MRAAVAGTSRALAPRVRIAMLALLVGCTVGSGASLLPRGEPMWLTSEPTAVSYNSKVVALRTTLGRAAIRLEMRGTQDAIRTAPCTDEDAQRLQAGCVRCDLAEESDQLDEAALDAMRVAFDRYPASFLIASHIENVALCKRIVYSDPTHERAAGTVDYKRRRLFINIEGFVGHVYDASGPFTVEDIVHHELFHLIEFEHMRNEMNDPEWRLYNPIGFDYSDSRGERFATRPIGFVNAYAATNEIEDRASTFEYMMARPAELCELVKADAVVRAKVKLIWTRVAKVDGDAWLRARALCGTKNRER
jgi:hypothetical protein